MACVYFAMLKLFFSAWLHTWIRVHYRWVLQTEAENKTYMYRICNRALETSVQNISVIHYDDVIMGARASQITSLVIVYSTVCSGADQSKHQRSASLAFVWGIHRGPVNSPHKWPVTRKMFPFEDVIMEMWIKFCQLPHLSTIPLHPPCSIISMGNVSIQISTFSLYEVRMSYCNHDWLLSVNTNRSETAVKPKLLLKLHTGDLEHIMGGSCLALIIN